MDFSKSSGFYCALNALVNAFESICPWQIELKKLTPCTQWEQKVRRQVTRACEILEFIKSNGARTPRPVVILTLKQKTRLWIQHPIWRQQKKTALLTPP